MTATTPDLVVQLCPGVGPLVDITDGQWTTVTESAVVDVSWQHGRQSEFDTFSAGTLSVTFEDRTRQFDPLNASGAYFGDLNPGMHIRVLARIGVTDYPRWRGFVESIVTTNARTTTFCTITASDGFKILNQQILPQSVYETVVQADSPWLYWRLGDEAGPDAVDSSGNNNDGVYSTGPNVRRGTSSVVPYTNNDAVGLIANGFGPVRSREDTAQLTVLPRTVEMWVRADDQSLFRTPTSTDQYSLFHQPAADSTTAMQITYNIDVSGLVAPYTIQAQCKDGTPDFKNFNLSSPLHDGGVHHIVVVFGVAGSTCYVDGLPLPEGASGSANPPDGDRRVFFGGLLTGSNGTTPDTPGLYSWLGSIDECAYYDDALQPAEIADHYEHGTRPWDGDFTGARISRILDLVGWPAGLRAIDAGEKVLGPADLAGVTGLQYCQLVAQSESGRFFIDERGYATFHDAGRFSRETVESTSQYTFSDDEAGDAVYSGGSFSRDDTLVYNQASIQRKYGLPQTAEDTTSVQNFGARTYSLTGLLHKSDAIARGLASFIVYRYKDPQSRVAQLTVQPEVDAASWPTLLALEIGHRVTVEQKPANTGTQIQLEQIIDHIAETVDGATWTMTLLLTPVDPHEDIYFTIGGDGATQGIGTGVMR